MIHSTFLSNSLCFHLDPLVHVISQMSLDHDSGATFEAVAEDDLAIAHFDRNKVTLNENKQKKL